MLRHIMVASLCVAVAGLAASCGDPYRRNLDHGFPSGVGVGADAAATNNFRGSLSRFHMADTDIGCMANEAFKVTPATDESGMYVWTKSELNGLAKSCRVDFSKLWYSTD
jgi:hypothetical protein